MILRQCILPMQVGLDECLMDLKKINYPKAGFTGLMLVYGFLCARDTSESGMLDRVNL
jgi:hypothetical protein